MAKPRKRAKSARSRQVECQEHGPSEPCMICRHLREGRGLGYILIEADARGFERTALCEECEQLLLAEDGWTGRLFDFADWRLYCAQCLRRELRRGRHRLVGRGRIAPDSE
jgi:hypothetical protein